MLGSEQCCLLGRRDHLQAAQVLSLPHPMIKGSSCRTAAAADPLVAGLRGGAYFLDLL